MKNLFRLSLLAALVAAALGGMTTVRAQGGLPVATVVCDQYLRSQPSETATPLDVLRPDEPMMLITGRDATGTWLVVLRQNGQAGWVMHTNCIRIQGDKNNAPLTAPLTYSGPPVVTIGCTQYVHSVPNIDSPRLLILYPGDGVLEVLGRDRIGEWLLVRRADGEMGWVVDTQCIRVEGDVFDAPVTVGVEMPVPRPDGSLPPIPESLPAATIGCTQYIRSAPRPDSARLAILYPDDGILEILGRDRAGEWLLIQAEDGRMGWVVDTQCIVVQGNVFDAPISTDVEMPIPGVTEAVPPAELEAAGVEATEQPAPVPLPNVTIGCTQYVRSAADDDSARLMILYPWDGVLEILARDRVGEWLLVRRADGAMGWVVNTQCVVVHGNVFDAPLDTSVVMPVPGVSEGSLGAFAAEAVPTDEPAAPPVEVPLPNVRIACAQYVRSAADNSSARLAILYPGGGLLEILARDRAAAWLLVRRPADGLMGWVVNTQCVVVNGNVFDAPLDTSVVMPVPTPVPEEPLPFPGATPPPGWPPQQ